jgi:hypothetical protein
MTVELRPITGENFHAVIKLEVLPEQSGFVAPNVRGIAETYPANSRALGLYRSAGFVETGEPDHEELVMVREV